MDPLLAIASAVTTYVVPKALEKIGEQVGEASLAKSEKAIHAIQQTVRGKLKATDTAGILTMTEKDPTESNMKVLQSVLLSQMKGDTDFSSQLQALLERIQSQTPEVQIVLDSVRVKGNVKLGAIAQTSQGQSSQQVIGRNLGVGGDLEIGDITQNTGI